MADTFSGILDELDNFSIPTRMEKFLLREEAPSASEQTLSFYAFAYERAFETLAGSVKDWWRSGGYMQLPMFYIARHSIELSLKSAIDEFAGYTGSPSPECGHHLLKLWAELNRQFESSGMPEEQEWGAHCGRLLNHIHQIDPPGEAFRYPHNLGGRTFEYTRVNFEGLVRAHHHITSYCGASLDMLADGRQY